MITAKNNLVDIIIKVNQLNQKTHKTYISASKYTRRVIKDIKINYRYKTNRVEYKKIHDYIKNNQQIQQRST